MHKICAVTTRPFVKILAAIIICSFVLSCGQQEQATPLPAADAAIIQQVDTLLRIANTQVLADASIAEKYYDSAYQAARSNNYYDGVFKYYTQTIGITGKVQMNFEKGFAMCAAGEKLADSLNNQEYKGIMHYVRGFYYHLKGEIDSAARHYTLAIVLINKDHTIRAKISANLADIYYNQSNAAMAIRYGERFYTHALTVRDTGDLAAASSNLYLYYTQQNDTAKAAFHIRNAFNLVQHKPNMPVEITVYNNYGEFLLDDEKYDSAFLIFSKQLDMARAGNYAFFEMQSLLNMSYVYYQNKNLPKAREYYSRARPFVEEFDIAPERLVNIYQQGYELAKSAGDKVAALAALEQKVQYSDTVKVREKSDELEKFEKELKRLEAKNQILDRELQIDKKNRTITVMSLLVLLITGAGVWGFTYYRKKQFIDQQQVEFLKKENEWNKLSARMEAQLEERKRIAREIHDDLGSSLTKISLLVNLITKDPAKYLKEELEILGDTSSGLVNKLNEIVWSLSNRNDTLESLVAYTRKNLLLSVDKTPLKFSFLADIPDEEIIVDGFIRRGLYLAIKESVHNIIKHSGATVARVNLDYSNQCLTVVIQDDGKGLNLDEKRGKGNGLLNIEENVKNVGGRVTFENDNGLKITIVCNF